MSYTTQDMDNAIEYSNQRLVLKFINLMYVKWPHLISHMEYEIVQADSENDYYYTTLFQPWAIKVETKLPAKLCEKISCNSAKQETTCVRNETASYYRVGDDTHFERHCEPACYHISDDPVYDDETGEEQTQMIRLGYYRDRCVILPPALVWQEFPFYRSSEVYEQRMNDLPMGFNRDTDLAYTYSGRNYKYNKNYCDAFYDKWDPDKQTCVVKWYERILYAVVGEAITKMVKAGIDAIGGGPPSGYSIPDNLPEIPAIEDVWTYTGWKGDINQNFIIPPEDFQLTVVDSTKVYREIPNKHTRIKVDIYKKRQNLVKLIRKKKRSISNTLRRKLENDYVVYISNKEKDEIISIEAYNKKYPKEDIRDLTHDDLKFKKKTGEEEVDENTTFFDTLGNIIGALIAAVATPEFWLEVGIEEISEELLKKFKKVAIKLADEIIPKLTNVILKTTTKMLSRVFTKTLFATISQCTSKILIKTLSKVLIKLTKLMAEIASVVGIILAILTIFDIILTIWDPLSFNNKFDEAIIASVMDQSDESLRMELEMAVPEMTFDLLSNLILSPDDILNTCVTSFNDIYQYLDSLTINSEGSRIIKGFELDPSVMNPDSVVDEGVINSKMITPHDVYLFEKDHAIRMRYFKAGKKTMYGLFAIASGLLVLELYMYALILFVVILILVFLYYLNTANLNVGKYTEDFFKLINLRL